MKETKGTPPRHPRDVEVLSCILTSPLISCFAAPHSKWCKMSPHHTKHPSCLIHIDDALIQLVHPMVTSPYLFFSPLTLSFIHHVLPFCLISSTLMPQSFSLFFSSHPCFPISCFTSRFSSHFSLSYTPVGLTSPLCFPGRVFVRFLTTSINSSFTLISSM